VQVRSLAKAKAAGEQLAAAVEALRGSQLPELGLELSTSGAGEPLTVAQLDSTITSKCNKGQNTDLSVQAQ
jgi:hypothetical protein